MNYGLDLCIHALSSMTHSHSTSVTNNFFSHKIVFQIIDCLLKDTLAPFRSKRLWVRLEWTSALYIWMPNKGTCWRLMRERVEQKKKETIMSMLNTHCNIRAKWPLESHPHSTPLPVQNRQILSCEKKS